MNSPLATPKPNAVMWWARNLFWLFLANICVIINALPKPQQQRPNGVTRVPGGTLIDCREPHGSYFPDPEDCRHFYHCSDWSGLQKNHVAVICTSILKLASVTGPQWSGGLGLNAQIQTH